MYGRWYTTAVVFCWLASMTWLVTTKILPPLQLGDPPSYAAIVAAQRGPERRLGSQA